MKYLIYTDIVTEGGSIMNDNEYVLAANEAEAKKRQSELISEARGIVEEQQQIVRDNPHIYDAPSFNDIVYSMIIEIEEDVSTGAEAVDWLNQISRGEIKEPREEGEDDVVEAIYWSNVLKGKIDADKIGPDEFRIARELDSVRVFSCYYDGDESFKAQKECEQILLNCF